MRWQTRINRVLGRATGFEVTRVVRGKGGRRRRARRARLDPAYDRLLVAPIFILASIRSGSTLLRMLLGSHSQLHAPHELHLRGVKVHLVKRNSVKAMHELRLDEASLEYLLWDRVLDRELQRSGKKYIVNKTPSDVFMWRRIATCWPDARFIFLLRHPLAVARSRQAYHPNQDLETNARKVLGYMKALEEARRELPGLTVRYEELAADPEGATRRMCAFLGLEWEPGMLEYGRREAGTYVRGLGDWGEEIRSGRVLPPRPLPDEEVPELLREICEAWGYARETVPASWS